MSEYTLKHSPQSGPLSSAPRIQKALIWVLTAVVLSPLGAIFFKNNCFFIINYYSFFIRTISHAILILFALWFILRSRTQNSISGIDIKKIKPQNLYLALMAVWMLISCLLADDVGKAFMGDWRGEGYLTYIAYFAIYFCAYIAADEKSFAKVFELFSFVSYYAGIIGLLVEFDVIYVSSNNEIHASIFANGNHYGYYLAIALIAAAYHFLASARSRKVLHGIGLFIISFSFFLSQCRGAWLAGTISLIAFSVFILIRRDRKPLAALTPIFIALAALVLTRFVYPGFADRMGSIVRDVNLIIKSDPSRIYTGTGRWLLWITGLKLIPAHPIFGYGLDNLSAPILSYAIDYTDRVHNEYLNYIVTIGIVGALAYFVFVFKIMITYLKKVITIDFFSFAIFCTAACYLASAFFGNTTPYVTPYLFMFLGFLSRGTGKWKAE